MKLNTLMTAITCGLIAITFVARAQQTTIGKNIYVNGAIEENAVQDTSDQDEEGQNAAKRKGGGIRLKTELTTKPGTGNGNGELLSVREKPASVIPQAGGAVTNQVIIGERNNQKVIIFKSDAENSGVRLGSESLSSATDARLNAVDNVEAGSVLRNDDNQVFLTNDPKVTVRADDVVIFNKNGEAACVRIGSVANENC